jgi:hypothetical protein
MFFQEGKEKVNDLIARVPNSIFKLELSLMKLSKMKGKFIFSFSLRLMDMATCKTSFNNW